MLIGRSAPINVNSGMIFDSTLALERVYLGLASGLVTGLLLLFVIYQAGKAKDRANQLAEEQRLIDGNAVNISCSGKWGSPAKLSFFYVRRESDFEVVRWIQARQ